MSFSLETAVGFTLAKDALVATYNLGKSAIEGIHFKRSQEVYSQKDMQRLLRARGAAANVLDVYTHVAYGPGGNIAPTAQEQADVVRFLLAGKIPGAHWRTPKTVPPLGGIGGGAVDAATAAGMPVGSNARVVLDAVYAQYNVNVLPPEHKAVVDKYWISLNGVDQNLWWNNFRDLDQDNPAFTGLNPLQQSKLRRYYPGTEEYEELRKHNYAAWKIVAARIERKRQVQDSLRSFGHFFGDAIKIVPLPGTSVIGNAINHLVDKGVEKATGPDYHTKFDADRKAGRVDVLSPDEVAKVVKERMGCIIEGVQSRLNEIYTGTQARPDGTQGPYHYVGLLLADKLLEKTLGPMLLNSESTYSDMVYQMKHSIEKMYTCCEEYKKYLDKHIKEILASGKNDLHDVFVKSIETFFAKLMNEQMENEPTIGARKPHNAFIPEIVVY